MALELKQMEAAFTKNHIKPFSTQEDCAIKAHHFPYEYVLWVVKLLNMIFSSSLLILTVFSVISDDDCFKDLDMHQVANACYYQFR